MKKAQLKKEIEILKEVGKLGKSKGSENFFKNCSQKYISSIGQCCHNITQNGFNFNKSQATKVRRKLGPIKKSIRDLANESIPIEKKRNILMKKQIGHGIISLLASTLIPLLVSAIKG